MKIVKIKTFKFHTIDSKDKKEFYEYSTNSVKDLKNFVYDLIEISYRKNKKYIYFLDNGTWCVLCYYNVIDFNRLLA